MSGDQVNRELTDVFRTLLPSSLKQFLTADPQEIMRIPEASSEVGELVVLDEGVELTVCVGRISHHHFSPWNSSGATHLEQMQDVARESIEWIEAVLADRVRFRVEYQGERVLSGSWWYAERGDGGGSLERTTRVVEYTWSGEQYRGGRTAE